LIIIIESFGEDLNRNKVNLSNPCEAVKVWSCDVSTVCSLSVSLIAKIATPAETRSPANSVVNQSGTYSQNFENSQQIEEIIYNSEFSFSNEVLGKWPLAGGDNLVTQCSS